MPAQIGPTKIQRTCQDCAEAFVGGAAARLCPRCRWQHRGPKPKKYVWTDERDRQVRERYDSRVRNRAAAIASSLGCPTWVIKKRAQVLGLSTPWPADRRDWTPDEERVLEDHAGRRHVNWLSKKLKRSLSSVVLKLKRIGLSRRVRDGYTLRDLEECFGCDHHVIERWVREGKLQVKRRNPEAESRSPWFVSDRAVLAFVRQHPLDFRLDKVDQHWFLDLVLGTSFLCTKDVA